MVLVCLVTIRTVDGITNMQDVMVLGVYKRGGRKNLFLTFPFHETNIKITHTHMDKDDSSFKDLLQKVKGPYFFHHHLQFRTMYKVFMFSPTFRPFTTLITNTTVK